MPAKSTNYLLSLNGFAKLLSRKVLMFDTEQSCDIMSRGNRGLSLLTHRTEQSHEAAPTRCSYTRGDYPTLS